MKFLIIQWVMYLYQLQEQITMQTAKRHSGSAMKWAVASWPYAMGDMTLGNLSSDNQWYCVHPLLKG